MKNAPLLLVLSLFALASCDSSVSPVDAMPSAARDAAANARDAASNATDGGPICTPNAVVACNCNANQSGVHVCASDGLSFSACDCRPDAGP